MNCWDDIMPMPSGKVVDCHVHLVAFPDGENGCYISPRMLKSPLSRLIAWKHGLGPDDARRSNQKYLDDLLMELQASQHVGKAVLLGMDGVYDNRGVVDLGQTDFLISNDYILRIVESYADHFLAGVSINPQRRDAIDELERCVASGAVLVKVLANAQGFDPGNRRYVPFYRKLAQLQIPLLSHVGYEFSLIGRDQTAGHPEKLRVPLDEGVTVIAAHGCSYGLMMYEKFYHTFLDLIQEYQYFFSDVSALTLPNRSRMLQLLRGRPDLHDRLLFGTDYPLSVYHWPAWGRVGMADLKNLIQTANRFDRQYLILKALGIGVRSFDDLLTRPV